MNPMDAIGLSNELESKKDLDLDQRVSKILDLIQFMSECLEQALRCKNLSNRTDENKDELFTEHNLSSLYRDLNPDKDSRIPFIIKQLFLGTYWVRYPMEQGNYWDSQANKIPPAILNKIRLLINTQSMEEVQKIQELVKSHFNEAIAFVDGLFLSTQQNEKDDLSIEWKSIDLTPPESIDTSQLETVLKNIISLKNSLPWVITHPAFVKFDQLLTDIRFLIQNCKELSQPIKSIQFSKLVRSHVIKETGVVERMLQLIYTLQMDQSTQNHDIGFLCDNISWSEEIDNNALSFLKEQFEKSHYTSRNPFQSKAKIVNLFHELVLKAERSREDVSLLEGYKTKNNKTETLLNFFPLSSKDDALSYHVIFNQLKTLSTKIVSIVNDELVHELAFAIQQKIGE